MTDSSLSTLRFLPVLAILTLAVLTPARGAGTAKPPVLIRGADVVTLTGEGVRADRDVLVDGGVIAAIEPSGAVDAPAGAVVVDAAGAYLLPGLIDAHVHLRREDQVTSGLAWGLTTIRSMEGAPEVLDWRDEIAAGERLGPTLVVASPILHREADGASRFVKVTTDAAARARVREYRGAGYDLVKIAELDDGPFFALMEEAGVLGMTVAGHTPNYELELRRVLAEGMASHEHLQELWELHEKQAEDASPASFAALLRKAGAVVTPILSAEVINNRLFAERRAYLTPARLEALRAAGGERAVSRLEGAIQSIEDGDWKLEHADLEETFAVLSALHEADVTFIAGTDSGGVLVPIGPGLHRELALYAEAGLPAEAALRAATVDAARVLGLADRGTVEVGKRADLLLVRSDPLRDVTHLREIVGVVVAGRWLPESELGPRVAAPADADTASP